MPCPVHQLGEELNGDRHRRRRDDISIRFQQVGYLFLFRDAADVDQHRAALATANSGPVRRPTAWSPH
jgi:hypothetical protein